MTDTKNSRPVEIRDEALNSAEGGAMHWGPSNSNMLGGGTVKPEFQVEPKPTLKEGPWADAGHGHDTLVFPKK